MGSLPIFVGSAGFVVLISRLFHGAYGLVLSSVPVQLFIPFAAFGFVLRLNYIDWVYLVTCVLLYSVSQRRFIVRRCFRRCFPFH